MISPEDRGFLTSLFDAAVNAADPKSALKDHLPAKPKGRTIVIGAGKGAAQLAAAFEDLWGEPVEGVVVTRYGYGAVCKNIKVLEAAHPVPDENGLVASEALFNAVDGLTEDDLVVALICGGGSSLLPAPALGLTLVDEIEVNEVLLASGVSISIMNLIRCPLSRIKGGRLAVAAFPAKVVSLVVSDVPGDDPALVASGPTVANISTTNDALRAIDLYQLKFSDKIMQYLKANTQPSPLPNDHEIQNNETYIIASARKSLQAAANEAQKSDIRSVILSDSIEGESREVAKMHAAIAREVASYNTPFQRPVVILSGGETTVTLNGDGKGKGGRNSEFLLSFAKEIAGSVGIIGLAADTDGIDGSENNAGAFADGDTISRLYKQGCDPIKLLLNNNAWTAFDSVDDLFSPGPTGTNVNDFRAILII